ncbi:MAG: GxxExxY protein [Planctomycetaceae bacterium]|nr:GxxExxY protein [Phycisphaerales bacterium]MCE2654284.1 GxxExxY protein [Planctomycetaceae bacterium]
MYNDDRRRDNNGYGRGGRGGREGERRGVPLSELDPALTAISHKVIGASRDVHMALGPGYDASVYRQALMMELKNVGVDFVPGHSFEIRYKDHVVGSCLADLFIANRFVVVVMARPGEVSSADRVALRSVLKAGGLELGLIINFAGRLLKDGLVRVLNPDKIPSLRDGGAQDNHDEVAPDNHNEDGFYDPDRGN